MSYKSSANATAEIYYYVTNLQGDILQLRTASGSTAASYTYNAWGKILTATGDMADINPLRYRGYYYDAETGFYYLQSRYYDPGICRFINADEYASTGQDFIGTNMFAYCGNNPVNMHDAFGGIPAYSTLIADTGGSNMTDAPVYDQTSDLYSSLSLGCGTFAGTCCEVAAAYNVAFYCGKEKHISNTISGFLNNGIRMTGFGYMGSNPNLIGRYFDSLGINYTKSNYSFGAEMDSNIIMSEGDMVVFSFWWERPLLGFIPRSGLHTVMARCEDGSLYTYNFGRGLSCAAMFSSYKELLQGKSVITVYYIPAQ